MPPGHELVVDGGRVFVLAPPVGEVRPRGPRTGLVVGIVVAAVLALIVLVGAVVVLLRGLAVSDGGTSPGAVRPPGRRTGSINVTLLDAAVGDCIQLSPSWPTVPDGEFGARIVSCRSGHLPVVLSIHPGVPRAEVAEIGTSGFTFCGEPAMTIWASDDGVVGTMICMAAKDEDNG
jgi:hypothetical protein